MDSFQEPGERPAIVSREYVLGMLARIFGAMLPDDLVAPFLDYLVVKGVVVRDGDSFSLAGRPEALRAFPAEAQSALHDAIIDHSRSPECPGLLRYVVPARRSGGSGSVSQSDPSSSSGSRSYSTPSPTDYEKVIARLKWDRQDHLRALEAFGEDAANRLIDHVIATLSRRPRDDARRAVRRDEGVPWTQIEASIDDEEGRQLLRELLEQQRHTGQPSDEKILNAVRDRQQGRRLQAELQAILDEDHSRPVGLFRRWTKLTEWGPRMFSGSTRDGRVVIDFKLQVAARVMYRDLSAGTAGTELTWAAATKEATEALWPLARGVFDASDLKPLHLLVRDMDAVLAGKEVDVRASIKDVGLIVDELAARQSTAGTPTGNGPPTAIAASMPPSRTTPEDADVLGTQQRTRLRRLEVLRSLPAESNKAIVASLDEFGEKGPDDSTVSKDLTALRKGGAVHPTKLQRTATGDAIVKKHAT